MGGQYMSIHLLNFQYILTMQIRILLKNIIKVQYLKA